MGIVSSQLQTSTDNVDGDGDGDDTILGPAMSSVRAYDHPDAAKGKSYGPDMSPLPTNDNKGPKPLSKKKKKKRRKSTESAASREADIVDAVSEHDPSIPKPTKKSKKKSRQKSARQEEPPVEVRSTQPEAQNSDVDQVGALPKRSKQKKARRKKNNDRHESDTELRIVAPDGANSPPPAQAPTVNGLHTHESGDEANADEMALRLSSQQNKRGRIGDQSQSSALSASQMNTEEPETDDEQLPAHFIGLSPTNATPADAAGSPTVDTDREDDEELDVEWLHKREEDETNGAPVPDTRDASLGTTDEPFPDLLPSQIKSAHPSDTDSDSDASSHSGSESESPTAARADRLEKSRSRSTSKASTSRGEGHRPADKAQLGISAPTASKPSSNDSIEFSSRASTPYSGPSSTGSDRTIPPIIESQRRSYPSEPSEQQRQNNDSRVDRAALPFTNGTTTGQVQPRKQQATGTDTDKGETTKSVGNIEHVAATNSQVPSSQARKQAQSAKKKVSDSPSNGLATDRDLRVLEDWGNGKSNHTPHSSNPLDVTINDGGATEPRDSTSPSKKANKDSVNRLQAVKQERGDAEHADTAPHARHEALSASLPQSSVKRRRPKSSFFESEAASEPQETVTATSPPAENETERNKSVEPNESASQPQPKGKRKRKLQPKTSLTLSQLEGDDTAEGESRLSTFSQRTKRKDMMRSGSGNNEPDPSEVGVSQEPSPSTQQPRKVRKKRRTDNGTSEDEMESLVAAGPSKTRKRASKLDFSDDEDARAAKRKRLSKNSGGAATGPWTPEEIQSIEKVYAEFREANDMTEEELNAMIHERPDKANDLHQEFWNRADVAVPQRTRKQIVERARRLHNNFTARGTWTEEQKEELHELFAKHGNKFSHIAGLINRDQKDVRDYWRNHYLVHETQVKRRWTKEEEARLKQVVEEALGKIRIQRENSGELRTRPRATGDDEESLLDWHQVSQGMGLTRSRAQCKWKWVDLREKGLVKEEGSRAPTQPPSSAAGSDRRITSISEELTQAREGFDKMTIEDKKQLVEAIYACKAIDDANIPWSRLVHSQFRAKWARPTLRLAWYRLRRSVPDYDENTVEENARYLLNHNTNFEDFPLIREGHIDDLGEESLIHSRPGKRLWKRPSQDQKAIVERQRRVRKQRAENPKGRVVRWLRERGTSVDLGDQYHSGEETGEERKSDHGNREDVAIQIPKHLKDEAAKKALANARAEANTKGSRKGTEPTRGMRSASVAIDSDSE